MNNSGQNLPTVGRKRPWELWLMLVADTAGVILIVTGFSSRSGSLSVMIVSLIGCMIASNLLWLTARRQLWFWSGFLLLGYVAGWASAIDLLVYEPFDQQYLAAMATFGFYLALGFMLGAMLEFIGYLHHILHGRDPWKYPASRVQSEG